MTDVLDAPSSPLGKPIKRTEDPRFITGEGRYLDDIKLQSMAHMAILRSPYAHANIRSIDTTRREGDARRRRGLRRRGHPVQPAADGLAGRRQRGHPEQRQHAPRSSPPTASSGPAKASPRSSPRPRPRRIDALEAIAGRLGAAPGGRRRGEGDRSRRAAAPRERPEQRRVRVDASATRPAPTRPSTAPRSSSASGSSTSGSSRTRWRPAATSAGTTRAPTSTRSGCRARRRTSSGCCWRPS